MCVCVFVVVVAALIIVAFVAAVVDSVSHILIFWICFWFLTRNNKIWFSAIFESCYAI